MPDCLVPTLRASNAYDQNSSPLSFPDDRLVVFAYKADMLDLSSYSPTLGDFREVRQASDEKM